MATNMYLVLIPSTTFGPARVALIPATARVPTGVHVGHGVALLGGGPGVGVGGNSRPGRFVARVVSTLAPAGNGVAYPAVPPSTPAGAFHGGAAILGSCLRSSNPLLVVRSSRGAHVVAAAAAGVLGEASEDDDFTIATPIAKPVGEDKGETQTWPSHFEKLAQRAVLLLQEFSDGSESFRVAEECLRGVGIKGSKGLVEVDQVREATRALKLVYDHLGSGRLVDDSAPFPHIRDDVQVSLLLTKNGDEMRVSVMNHEVLLTVLFEDLEQAIDVISKVV